MINVKGIIYLSACIAASLGIGACSSTEATPQVEPTPVPQTQPQKPVKTVDINALIEANAAGFHDCLVQLQNRATREGISDDTVMDTVAKLQFVPKVIELDNAQPEFSQTFYSYFTKRATDWRISEGQRLLRENRALLTRLEQQYGVPPQYLLSFWGLETNYGTYKGKMSVLDSLATLACEQRRAEYFTTELMQALKLKEKYGFDKSTMVGSWAGAMGHTQFMPSAYAKYALDGDGDGKADLWNSTADALTSAANFLQQLGWQRSERWGREVTLPANFNYQHLGAKQAQPLSVWAGESVRETNGKLLPSLPMKAALYLPSGHTGPAFLGYENFNVIMRWNRSEFYAITVGHLADRIMGAEPLKVTPPDLPRLSREQVKLLQTKLNEAGFDVGAADGVLGRNSVAGIQAFQRSNNMIADGFPSPEVFNALGIAL
ncbi:lytic murein transglycosylase [Shewanella sp. A25]|nr:lytic murein transglycosylase [Shewanella shenzhenensis]